MSEGPVGALLCAYVGCPLVATIVNRANAANDLLSLEQRRVCERLLHLEPHRQLCRRIATPFEPTVLASGAELPVLPAATEYSSCCARSQSSGCHGGGGGGDGRDRWLGSESRPFQVKLGSLCSSNTSERLTLTLQTTTHAGGFRTQIASGIGVHDSDVALLHQGKEISYTLPLHRSMQHLEPQPRASSSRASLRAVDLAFVVEPDALVVNEATLAHTLSCIRARVLLVDSARAFGSVLSCPSVRESALGKFLKSSNTLETIVGFLVGPVHEFVEICKATRETTSRSALDHCFAASSTASSCALSTSSSSVPSQPQACPYLPSSSSVPPKPQASPHLPWSSGSLQALMPLSTNGQGASRPAPAAAPLRAVVAPMRGHVLAGKTVMADTLRRAPVDWFLFPP